MVYVVDSNGCEVHRQLVDFYSKVPADGYRYISPVLPADCYHVIIEATGLRSNWTDKAKNIYGTNGSFVRVSEVMVLQ